MILSIFSFVFLLIMGLMACYRGFSRISTIESTIKTMYWFSAFAACVAVVGVVWEYLAARKGTDLRYKVVRGRNLAVASAFTAVCSLVAARFFVDGIKALYVIIPTVTILTLVYLIYSAEFFIIASVTSLTGLLMWHLSQSYYSRPFTEVRISVLLRDYSFIAAVLLLILLVLTIFLVRSVSRHGGEMRFGRYSWKFTGASANYPLIYASTAISALSTVAALLFGAGTAYYLMFAVFGYLFILAVYYTVKLM